MQMARIKKGLLIAMSIFLVMACTEQKITEVSFDPGDVVPQEVLDTMNIDRYFTISEIPDTIFEFMQGRSYKADCTIPRSDLRYLIILHRNMDGQAVVGELVVNKEISADILDIMRELYELNYPIEQVRLVDYYEGDDELSMAANNSSAFNWRTQTGSSAKISKHATGMAIDIRFRLAEIFIWTGCGNFRSRLMRMMTVTASLQSMVSSGAVAGTHSETISISKNSITFAVE